MTARTVYLNGAFMPIEAAHISVLDRGFIFGDGVYEVIPVYSRHPFRLEAHLQRLQFSLDGIRLANPHAPETWARLIETLIRHTAAPDQSIYLQITRGVAPRDHAFPTTTTPTVFMMSNPLTPPPPEQVEQGVALITLPDNRWGRCDLKTIALLPNVLLRQQAVDAAVAEAMLFRDGLLTEGTASNILMVEQGTLYAPPPGPHLLPGITCDVLLELAKANGIPVCIAPLPEARVRAADELWLCSSTREVLAAVTLDDQAIGTGHPGPLFRTMHARYQEYKQRVMRGAA